MPSLRAVPRRSVAILVVLLGMLAALSHSSLSASAAGGPGPGEAAAAAPRDAAGGAQTLAEDPPPNRAQTGETADLTTAKALLLGAVEGLTEYLPISSTGHLTVTERLIDVGTHSDADREAADSYAVAIQAGAILAVLVLYRSRVASLFGGLTGRSAAGRPLLLALIAAFVPAALLGVALGDTIKAKLFGPGPVAIAWAVGGAAILYLAPRLTRRGGRGLPLEALTPKLGLVIGCAQVAALWPGVSRSLVTLLAGLGVGLSLIAAVEFSFLLGLATLGAATVYEVAKNGQGMVDAYGLTPLLLGAAAALVTALFAVRWMVGYLQRRDLSIFGWYRLGAAAVVGLLMVTGVL